MGDSKLAVASLASILLVAMVVAVAVTISKGGDGNTAPASSSNSDISSSAKAVHSICSPTDYKETCEKSLAGAKSDDPKELIRIGFQAAVSSIRDAVKNSTLYKEAAADERSKKALKVCEQVLGFSIDDLQRSFDDVGNVDITNLNEYVDDVKIWISGAIAHHESCIDAFENTTGDIGVKMKKALESSSEMLSNCLAMVNEFSTFISDLLGLPMVGGSRRVLSVPSFVDAEARNLMETTPETINASIVVAKDGSGKFKTIAGAIASVPEDNKETVVIHVKAGIYKENVVISKTKSNIKLIGDGPLQTRITGSKSFADGFPIYDTAVLAVNSDGFMAKDIAIENTAGPEMNQAVAVRVSGDKTIFHNVHIDGYQATLFAESYRQYYCGCVISGTIDIIMGDAVAVIQKSKLLVRKPADRQDCMVTAQGRTDKRDVGVTVIQNCEIVSEPGFTKIEPPVKAFLGRPWKSHSRTIIMQSFIDKFIAPQGWTPWFGKFGLETLYYGEYKNRGPGSTTSGRVTWTGIQHITPEIAESFSAGKLFGNDVWVRAAKIPYDAGMMLV